MVDVGDLLVLVGGAVRGRGWPVLERRPRRVPCLPRVGVAGDLIWWRSCGKWRYSCGVARSVVGGGGGEAGRVHCRGFKVKMLLCSPMRAT